MTRIEPHTPGVTRRNTPPPWFVPGTAANEGPLKGVVYRRGQGLRAQLSRWFRR